ncbi:MAG: antitoxin VapB family protein [Candidatus Bathyarchaeota archaeon]
MPSKNISITDDVYEILARMKLEGESFSDTIRRLAKRGSLAECAGLWADMPDAEYRALMEGVEALKEGANQSMRRRLHEAG